MATPAGEQPIATLKPGDPVLAYDPTTGHANPQTVAHTFVNHDANLLDVTLRVTTEGAMKDKAAAATSDATTRTSAQQPSA